MLTKYVVFWHDKSLEEVVVARNKQDLASKLTNLIYKHTKDLVTNESLYKYIDKNGIEVYDEGYL